MEQGMIYQIGEAILLEVEGVQNVEYVGNEEELVIIMDTGKKIKLSIKDA